MSATSTLIGKYLSSYQKAEAVRTTKWVGKQIKRVDAAIKRNCKLDAAGAVTKCGAI